LRKIRWSAAGRGKRGGVRVIHHWQPRSRSIHLLLAYAKTAREDLTRSQLRALRRIVGEELG
jgi:hypothetical protein